MSDTEISKDALREQGVEEAKELARTPVPKAMGNEKIAILKHDLSDRNQIEEYQTPPAVELAIRNVSDSPIATAIFEAVLYDEEGNIVDKVRHGEVALDPATSRAIRIVYAPYQDDRVKSYDVRIIRTTTTDEERVQLRRHETRTTDSGEEEIKGIVKNISQVKTDAAVIATFYDLDQEDIGTKVVVLRDIAPNTVRQFDIRFKPREGEIVRGYTLKIGEIAG